MTLSEREGVLGVIHYPIDGHSTAIEGGWVPRDLVPRSGKLVASKHNYSMTRWVCMCVHGQWPVSIQIATLCAR